MDLCYDLDLCAANTWGAASATGPKIQSPTWFGGPSTNGTCIDFVLLSRRGLFAVLSACRKLPFFDREAARKVHHVPLILRLLRVAPLPAKHPLLQGVWDPLSVAWDPGLLLQTLLDDRAPFIESKEG